MVLGWGKVDGKGGVEGHDGNRARQVRFWLSPSPYLEYENFTLLYTFPSANECTDTCPLLFQILKNNIFTQKKKIQQIKHDIIKD